MSWSAHFFHPRRSAREAEEIRRYADEMTAYAESVEVQLTEAVNSAEALQKERDSMLKDKIDIEKMAEQLLSQLAEARQERDKYAAELKKANEQVEQINEIAELVKRFGELKENYEQRITRLKDKLADARLAIRRLSAAKGIAIADDDLVPIDFDSPIMPMPVDYSVRQTPKPTAPKPIIPQPKATAVAHSEVSQNKLFDDAEIDTPPTSSPEKSSDDNWLQPLPDDI